MLLHGECSCISEDEGADKDRASQADESHEERDPVRIASRKPLEMDARIGELEKAHGVLFLEKAMGLLAAILPQDTNVSVRGVDWTTIRYVG